MSADCVIIMGKDGDPVLNFLDSSLWKELSAASNAFEHSMDPLHRKQTGSYYTALELAYAMMKDLVRSFSPAEMENLHNMTFLEPCVGTGNFVFAYLVVCWELGLTREQYSQLVNNIYACDINAQALAVYQKNLLTLVRALFEIQLDADYFSSHVFSGLLFDVTSASPKYISLGDCIHTLDVSQGVDLVVTNPPYKNLKAERTHYKTDALYEADKTRYTSIGQLAREHLRYSTTGTLNTYKMFVEEITDKYLSPSGHCSLLIPASILTDKSCTRLREHLFDSCELHSLRMIPEDSNYVDAAQALCAIQLHKGSPNRQTIVSGSLNGSSQENITIAFDDLVDRNAGCTVLVLSQNEYRIRKAMQMHPSLKSLSYITNLRGELDLTLNKKYVTLWPTPYRLLRGRNIGYYQLTETDDTEYVDERFLAETAKAKYLHAPRLVCQQIANMAKKRRVSFALAPENVVLGNSCNFLSVGPNDDGVDLYYLLGVLNSPLIDWYFRLSSSNNHINNYEIDTFPIPVKTELCHMISDAVQTYLHAPDEKRLQEINDLVNQAYGITDPAEESSNSSTETVSGCIEADFYRDVRHLIPRITPEDCTAVFAGQSSLTDVSFQKKPDLSPFEKRVLLGLEAKYHWLAAGSVLNHTTFKLSDLDLEMIRPVPQGGSWKDIPAETVQKSKRLIRITQTGGRTTLYGRIDYTKPSYTITTYFNRPGNGTYIHPVHDRVLTVREAARFQTFPDDYYFCGNKTDLLKQVGNAVPVLLAYSIGRKIVEKTGCRTSVDLFSGAGGMTCGFKLAGIQACISNDLAESACVTLKTNSPEIPVLCGDITQDETKQTIIQAGIAAGADIICGGPPCQGFSLAGFRMADDPRNELFRHFVDIVSGVSPKVIVFENVEGLLSYNGGETYRNIIQLFSELGYHCEGRKLLANQYGVPQKRKRVIILCVRKDLELQPGDLYPDMITPNEDRQISAYDTISDLEALDCTAGVKYAPAHSSPLIRFFRREITASQYFDLIRDPRGILAGQTDQLSLFE